jgi:hypothetical protein
MSITSRPTCIAVNITSGPAVDVFITDLGANVPASSTLALQTYFFPHEIHGSGDLLQAIIDDKLRINDGTTTLDEQGSINYITSVMSAQDLQDGVIGPATSTDTAIALYDGTTGKIIKNSGVLIDGSNNIDINGGKITDLGTPTAATDAATKGYVDSLVQGVTWRDAVESFGVNTPPGSPATGDRYVVGSSPTGAWTGQANNIAEWDGSSWVFETPLDGWALVAKDTDQQWIYNGTAWVSFGSTINHSALQNLTADDHLQYLPRSGVRAMTGNLDMGGQSITNVNLVDGVDVSAHGTRHNPGGVDPITTAVAVGLDATSTNAEGTAGSVARSDHTHALDTTTGTVATLQAGVASSGGTSAGLARKDHVHAIATGGSTVGIAPNNVAAEGTSANLAREDHVHALPTATPITVGTTNSAGTADSVARSDHLHRLELRVQQAGTAVGQRPTLNFTGTSLTITDDGVNDRVNINIAGGGDVTGPASATDNAIARYDGTTGKIIQNSAATVDDNGFIDNNEGKFNGIRYYNSSATDPVTPTPADGDRYYNTTLKMWMVYDGSRSKFLSEESMDLDFGRNGATAPGSYYRGADSAVMGAARGIHAFYNGTVVGLSYTRSDSDSADFEVTASGTTVASLNSTSTSGRSNSLNGNFAAGDVLAARNGSGGNATSDVFGKVRLKWRV